MMPDTFALTELVLFVFIVMFAVVTAFAVWMFYDADARGKNPYLAAGIAILSGFAGIWIMLIVFCGWILVRPEKIPRGEPSAKNRFLPDQLPSEPSSYRKSEDFLVELELIE